MAGLIDDNKKPILEEAVQQFIDARLQGQEADIDEFVKQYPGLEHEIRQRIQKLHKIKGLFDSLVHAEQEELSQTLSFAGSAVSPGSQIRQFRIEQELGRGGMGVVYLAHDTKLERSVAIKSVPPGLLGDSTARKRFRREAKALASLNHPNIAVIYEIIEQEEEVRYLVLEYVPGETLAERIAREPLKLEAGLSIAQQVADAVAAAHEKGMIHRDLKPGNIKIRPDGSVKVLDFGLAKSADEAQDHDITVTRPGSVIGTPAYMSPEQARSRPADERSDIWSFGCILYEMLTGEIPFKGETASDTLVRILDREPDWKKLPANTPANILVLLRRCLEKEAQKRLQHIGDAAIEIRETLSLPAAARPLAAPASFESAIRVKPRLRRIAIIIGAAVIVALCAIGVWLVLQQQAQPASKEIRLVVLPFENLGSADDEYFAAGITDAITARLVGIHGLSVISRQSARQYKDSEKAARVIGEELNVDYILEGTIQRERPSDPNSKLRIIPQLVSVSDDAHVWAEPYDSDTSRIFELQSNVAERVAEALGITLLEAEQQALQARPTENVEAYEYYLRGQYYTFRDYGEADMKIAIRMYKKAVDLDPTFALAYADLSSAHVDMYWFYYDRSEERLTMAKQAIDKALQLDPDLPEAHKQLGWYYYHGLLDYERALEQFAIALKSRPNDNDLVYDIAAVQRRQGKFEQALANFRKASELAPLLAWCPQEAGQILLMLRRYREAEGCYDRAISLSPDWANPYRSKAWLYVLWQGNTEKARAVMQTALQHITSTDPLVVDMLVMLDVYDRNYEAALERLALMPEDVDYQYGFMPRDLRYAQVYGYMNKEESEQKHYESARNTVEAKVQQHPEDARLRSVLGIAYAGLRRKEDAIREGELAVELMPLAKDACRGALWVEDLAQIYVMVGEFDAAIDQLESLLSVPSELSIPLLKLDPAWDPLREHPRLKKLLETKK